MNIRPLIIAVAAASLIVPVLQGCQADSRDFEGDGAGSSGIGNNAGDGGRAGEGGDGSGGTAGSGGSSTAGNAGTSSGAGGEGGEAGTECEPGELFCSGNTVRRCAGDGLSSEEEDICESDEYCSATTAQCEPGVCETDAPACDGNRATTCNATGDGYLDGGEECGPDTSCESGTCSPHVCAPSEQFCQDQDVKQCSENGLASTVVQTCSGSTPYCDDGECRMGVTAIAAGEDHTCALLSTGSVRCWGLGTYGRLGYGNTDNVGDNETPASAGNVDVGGTVTQITAGNYHTCALLSTGQVRCWGWGSTGRLGYANSEDIGDNETPASVGTVNVGGAVTQIATGGHTCALLSGGNVRCWGFNMDGQLGYGNTISIGDNETPASVGTVNVGGTVTKIALGSTHTCALLSGGNVRCWGSGNSGQLGYGNTDNIGDNETPASVGTVNVGGVVTQIATGTGSTANYTCALLSTGNVRCWGRGASGQLGYGNTDNVGDDETPASVGPVNVGGTVTQIAGGGGHTCALLSGGTVRCWGRGASGQLGYSNIYNIGDDETPTSAGDVPVF